MVKKIFITSWTVLLIISCSSFTKINMKKDPNKFYFDDYISDKVINLKSELYNYYGYYNFEQAEKKFLEVFPLGADVNDVIEKIRKMDNGMICQKQNDFKSFGNFDFEYNCKKSSGLIVKETRIISIYTDDKFKLKKVDISYDKGSPLFMHIIALPFMVITNFFTGEY